MTSTEPPGAGGALTAPVAGPRKSLPTVIAVLILAGGSSVWPALGCAAAHPAEAPSLARQTVLINMVREDCGSCHGSRLTGGLGPALTPKMLRGKDPVSLQDTILFGRAGTPMPPWEPFLSKAEAAWIVDRLMKGFPDAP